MFKIFKFKTKEDYISTFNELRFDCERSLKEAASKFEEDMMNVWVRCDKDHSALEKVYELEAKVKTLETQIETILNIVRR
jgi:hypothetical protein